MFQVNTGNGLLIIITLYLNKYDTEPTLFQEVCQQVFPLLIPVLFSFVQLWPL